MRIQDVYCSHKTFGVDTTVGGMQTSRSIDRRYIQFVQLYFVIQAVPIDFTGTIQGHRR